ncbi:MAG: hypothetical protein IJX98_01965 [Clostridia bacterium]|nr:hypothetical protein [Clostridia bacterium]
MTYEEALEIIEREFETRYVAPRARAVRVNQSYNGYELFYIEINDDNGEGVLTDLGITKEMFYEVGESDWRALCRENGFSFNRYWHIERRFTAMTDLYDFIDFLILISDKYAVIGG